MIIAEFHTSTIPLIVKKSQKGRFQWYGHVMCADEKSLTKIGLRIVVDGKQLEAKTVRNNVGLIRLIVIWKPFGSVTDLDEPIPLLSEKKTKKDEEDYFLWLLHGWDSMDDVIFPQTHRFPKIRNVTVSTPISSGDYSATHEGGSWFLAGHNLEQTT